MSNSIKLLSSHVRITSGFNILLYIDERIKIFVLFSNSSTKFEANSEANSGFK